MDEWHIGDPVDWGDGFMDAQNWGHGQDDDEEDKGYNSNQNSEYQRYLRKAEECSRRGNHSEALDYYEKARNGLDKMVVMILIAKEYELMGNYDYALTYWKDLCNRFSFSEKVFQGHANLAYRMGKYEEAITSYKKALNIIENSHIKSPVKISSLNADIARAYRAWGRPHTAETYQNRSKKQIDNFVEEKMERADGYFKSGDCYNARNVYRTVLKHDPNNVKAKNRITECDRVLNLSIEEQKKYKEKAQEKLKQEEDLRIKREKREKREQERIAREKRMRELEEQQRKRKEECEKNPDCVKKEIQHFKKKVLKDYYLLLHFDHYQNKSDVKFKAILEYEDLLEKLGVKETYSREDLKDLKKENRRIKYIISHVDDKYRGNGVKLFVKNQKKINELEKRYPEKGFFKSIINEVFDNSEDIVALEVETSARDKIQIARTKSLSNNTVYLQEAIDLINQANAELFNYLKNKNPNQYPYLLNLKNDISSLERKIYRKIDNLINSDKRRLFLIDREKYPNNQFESRPGDVLKLVKEDGEDIITVFYKNEPVGIVSNKLNSDFEKQFSDTSQLQYLPKNSDAKYYFKYGRFEILEIEEATLRKEKSKLKFRQQKLINKYPKEELITITNNGDIELEQGMKFKLIKSDGSIDVYLDGNKIGIVANNPVCNLTSKASDIKKLPDVCYAEYLCKYEYNYHVAWIIDKLKPVKDHISKNEYDKAIECLDELLAEEPANMEFWSIKCSCHNNLKQYDEVDNCYDKLIELNSNKSEYWEMKASNLITMKRFDDAIDCLDEAISIDQYNPTFYSLKGTALKLKEKEELSIKQEKILKEYSKHELITINETQDHNLKNGMILKLIKEADKIIVYLDDNNIGYVANSKDTVCDLTSDARNINYIPEICYAKYIMNYCNDYHIAQIITDTRYIKVKLALEYINKEEYSKALDCYNEVLELYPHDEFCLYRKAEVLLLLKRWPQAIECYDILNSWGGKAYVYIQKEEYEDAFDCFDKLLESHPGHMRTLREKGRLLIDLERFDEAIECLDKALSQHPDEQSVLSLKEYALSCLKEIEEKQKNFKLLLDKISDLNNQERYEEALECLDEALDFEQDEYYILYLKGETLTKLERYGEAIECLDNSFELDHTYVPALNAKGIALTHLERFDVALACFDEALFLNPKDSDALKLKGKLFLIGKDYQKAIKYFEKAIKLDSDDAILWGNLAEAYLNINDISKGLEYCDKALALDSDNFDILFTAAKIHYELKQYDKAMEYATKAKELNETDSNLIDLIGKINKKQSEARIAALHKILR